MTHMAHTKALNSNKAYQLGWCARDRYARDYGSSDGAASCPNAPATPSSHNKMKTLILSMTATTNEEDTTLYIPKERKGRKEGRKFQKREKTTLKKKKKTSEVNTGCETARDLGGRI